MVGKKSREKELKPILRLKSEEKISVFRIAK